MYNIPHRLHVHEFILVQTVFWLTYSSCNCIRKQIWERIWMYVCLYWLVYFIINYNGSRSLFDDQYLCLTCMQSHMLTYRGKKVKGYYALSTAFEFACLQPARNQLDRGACWGANTPFVRTARLVSPLFIRKPWAVSLLSLHCNYSLHPIGIHSQRFFQRLNELSTTWWICWSMTGGVGCIDYSK